MPAPSLLRLRLTRKGGSAAVAGGPGEDGREGQKHRNNSHQGTDFTGRHKTLHQCVGTLAGIEKTGPEVNQSQTREQLKHISAAAVLLG